MCTGIQVRSRSSSEWTTLYSCKYFKFLRENSGERKEKETFLGVESNSRERLETLQVEWAKREVWRQISPEDFKVFASDIAGKSPQLFLFWKIQKHFTDCYFICPWEEERDSSGRTSSSVLNHCLAQNKNGDFEDEYRIQECGDGCHLCHKMSLAYTRTSHNLFLRHE